MTNNKSTLKPFTLGVHANEEPYRTDCPECGGIAKGEGLVATGIPFQHEVLGEYQPFPGEVLKNRWVECQGKTVGDRYVPSCGWWQVS